MDNFTESAPVELISTAGPLIDRLETAMMVKNEQGANSSINGGNRSVVRVPGALARLPTEFGEFNIAGYCSVDGREQLVALYMGEMRREVDTLARIHSQCLTGEVFCSLKCDCAAQLRGTMRMIQMQGCGAIVYQFQEGRGIGIVNKIRAYALQDVGADTVEANQLLGFEVDLREFKQCADVLVDLNLYRVRLISNNPQKILAVQQAGLMVVDRVSLPVSVTEAAARYLHTKQEKMGHLLATLQTGQGQAPGP